MNGAEAPPPGSEAHMIRGLVGATELGMGDAGRG